MEVLVLETFSLISIRSIFDVQSKFSSDQMQMFCSDADCLLHLYMDE